MHITADFDTSLVKGVRITLQDDISVQTKTISMEDYIRILNNSRALDKSYTRIGKLPQGYVDGFVANGDRITGKLLLHLQKGIHRCTLIDEKNTSSVGFPHLLFVFEVQDGVLRASRVYAVKDDQKHITNTTPVYLYPYGNVSTSTGGICWGGNIIPNIDDFRYLNTLMALFVTSPTNTHLYQQDKTSLYLSLSELLLHFQDKEFNEDVLIPCVKQCKEHMLVRDIFY